MAPTTTAIVNLIEAVREAVAHPDLPPLFGEVLQERLHDIDRACPDIRTYIDGF